MPIPQHTISIFQRPKEGSHFQKRIVALNYQHTISALGGFDTASCDVGVRSQGEGQDYLNNYLGCFVQCFADNTIEPIWEGLINRITFNSGGASYSIGLDELANRVSVVATGAANAASETTIANNTISQSIYGIKQDQIEFGVQPAGTHANTLRDTVLAQRAFPLTSITQGQGSANLVHLELIGIFHTLEWEKVFTVTSAAATAFGTRVGEIVTAIANTTTFFDNSDLSRITANAPTTPRQGRGMSQWELILKMAEAGDATNYWVAYISPTNWQTGKRVLVYEQANATIEYTARQSDGLRIRNLYGRIVPAWTVRPNKGIRVTDVLVGYNSNVQTDPRETYIKSIQYDANRQQVQYFGDDDTSARAAFMLKRGFKPIGRAFGATLRTIST